MNTRKIAASVSSLILLFTVPVALGTESEKCQIGITAAADYDFEYIGDDDASSDWADLDDVYDDVEEGHYSSSYDNRAVERKYNPIRSFIICLIIGIIAGLIGVSIMRSSMKSVHKKTGAADYRKENSLKLRLNQDTYLGEKTEKSPVARANSASPTNINTRK